VACDVIANLRKAKMASHTRTISERPLMQVFLGVLGKHSAALAWGTLQAIELRCGYRVR
jgi:hypothetical protein